MKTTASVARRVHRSTNPGFWAHLEQRRKEKAGERNLSPRLKGGVPETINAGKKKREPHKSEVRALGAAACRLKSVDKKDTRYKARAQKTAHPTKMRCANWVRQLAAWWTQRDSNPRPLGCEPNALPAELQAHISAAKGISLDGEIYYSMFFQTMQVLKQIF